MNTSKTSKKASYIPKEGDRVIWRGEKIGTVGKPYIGFGRAVWVTFDDGCTFPPDIDNLKPYTEQ